MTSDRPNERFYEGQLETALSVLERPKPFYQQAEGSLFQPVVFLDTEGAAREARDGTSTSYVNDIEASVVQFLVKV